MNRIRKCSTATLLATGILVLSHVAVAAAHDFSITQVVAVFKSDGAYVIDMRIDVDALALGVSSVTPSEQVAAALRALPPAELEQAIERARGTILHRVQIRFDGRKYLPSVSFPEYGDPNVASNDVPTVLGTTARLAGRVPLEATIFTFTASRTFNVVQLTIFDEATAAGTQYNLGVSTESPPYRIHEEQIEDRDLVLARYCILGIQHIVGFDEYLPLGLDHILFVFGLFLLSARLRPLLWQISAFTIAHTVSLSLSMSGIARLPSSIVEPLIALSITYVAVENIFVRDLKPWRPAIVFAFGLLHGMGFAGVLRELGLPEGRFVTALLGFNVGVEFGQLTVVAIGFLVLGWFRKKTWYRTGIIRPLSLLIALVGAYWAVERAFFGG